VTAPPGRAVRQAVPCGKGNPRAPVAGESAVWGITARPAAVPHNASRHGPAVPHNDSGRGPAVPQNAPATEPRAARRSAAMASPSWPAAEPPKAGITRRIRPPGERDAANLPALYGPQVSPLSRGHGVDW